MIDACAILLKHITTHM